MNFFYTQFINEGFTPSTLLETFFSPNWLIFGTMGFSGTRNRLAQVPSSEKIFMIPYRGTPCGNFFGPRDMRQSISRPRKLSSTKNQPIWSQNNKVEKIDFFSWGTPIGSHKNFLEFRNCANRFLVPKNPEYQKSSNLEKNNFFRKAYCA